MGRSEAVRGVSCRWFDVDVDQRIAFLPVLLVEYGITFYNRSSPVICRGGYWSMYAKDNVEYNERITFCSPTLSVMTNIS
jgi:hypothetical protein